MLLLFKRKTTLPSLYARPPFSLPFPLLSLPSPFAFCCCVKYEIRQTPKASLHFYVLFLQISITDGIFAGQFLEPIH